jgi:hypothetical protein
MCKKENEIKNDSNFFAWEKTEKTKKLPFKEIYKFLNFFSKYTIIFLRCYFFQNFPKKVPSNIRSSQKLAKNAHQFFAAWKTHKNFLKNSKISLFHNFTNYQNHQNSSNY